MPKIVVVSDNPREELSQYGDVVQVSPVYIHAQGRLRIGARKLGILRAMRDAVEASEPGDLIIQADMILQEDPFQTELKPGTIRTLTQPLGNGKHFCPRAFIVSDEETKVKLLELWEDETQQSCFGWGPIPKVIGPIVAYHADGAGEGRSWRI
jgi:hypothetical protein